MVYLYNNYMSRDVQPDTRLNYCRRTFPDILLYLDIDGGEVYSGRCDNEECCGSDVRRSPLKYPSGKAQSGRF